jgi:hypothetical protein
MFIPIWLILLVVLGVLVFTDTGRDILMVGAIVAGAAIGLILAFALISPMLQDPTGPAGRAAVVMGTIMGTVKLVQVGWEHRATIKWMLLTRTLVVIASVITAFGFLISATDLDNDLALAHGAAGLAAVLVAVLVGGWEALNRRRA